MSSTFEIFDYSNTDVKYQTDQWTVGVVKQGHSFGRYTSPEALAVYSDSLSSFYEFLEEHCPTPARDRSSSKTGEDGFNTFQTYEEAIDTFHHKPEKIRTFKERNELIKSAENVGNSVDYDMWGDFVDVGRYLEGVPEVYGRFEMGNPLGLFATIVINGTAPCYVDEKIINRRGERILRLADWLETQNIRTQIRYINISHCNVVELTLKRFEDVLDINSLAVVSHSEFLRRLIFRAIEYSKTFQSGYGIAHSMKGMGEILMKDEFGININVDWFDKMEKVDEEFDALEKRLEVFMDEGERSFTTLLTGARDW